MLVTHAPAVAFGVTAVAGFGVPALLVQPFDGDAGPLSVASLELVVGHVSSPAV